MTISFGDTVRILSTPTTDARGLAGLTGMVFGETRPSITGVAVIGGDGSDSALNVQLDGQAETLWFAPDLLEFVDHSPGTEIVIGHTRRVRSASGEWIDPKDAVEPM